MKADVLVVGLGQIGMGYDLDLDAARFVLSHARAFSQHDDFHLAAGVDSDPGKRQTFESVYDRPAYADISQALAHHQPDVIVIGVPTVLHTQVLDEVLAHSSPMVILCEKPLAYDLEAAGEMVAACEESGVKLFVNYIRRSDPAVVEIQRRIARGELGAEVKGMAWYSKGFVHNGSHFVNLLEYWLGEVRWSKVLDPGREINQADREPDVQIGFERGSVVLLAAWEEAFPHYGIELLGQNGRLRYLDGGSEIEWRSVESHGAADAPGRLGQPEAIASGMDRYQWNVANEISRSLRGEAPELCTGTSALRTLQAIKTILEP